MPLHASFGRRNGTLIVRGQANSGKQSGTSFIWPETNTQINTLTRNHTQHRHACMCASANSRFRTAPTRTLLNYDSCSPTKAHNNHSQLLVSHLKRYRWCGSQLYYPIASLLCEATSTVKTNEMDDGRGTKRGVGPPERGIWICEIDYLTNDDACMCLRNQAPPFPAEQR